MEAQPPLHERRLTFPSQANLFGWIEHSRSSDLKRVHTVTLRMTDVDLSSLLGSPTGEAEKRPSAWALYQQELEKLSTAFLMMPNISDLTITPPRTGGSQLLRALYLSALALIPHRWPKLKRLVIDDDEAVLEKLSSLQRMANVVFTVPRKRPDRKKRDSSREGPRECEHATRVAEMCERKTTVKGRFKANLKRDYRFGREVEKPRVVPL